MSVISMMIVGTAVTEMAWPGGVNCGIIILIEVYFSLCKG